MAALALAAPGTEYGPCAEPCNHTDCAANRRSAAATCRLCGSDIGYERRMYVDPEGEASRFEFVHAACIE